MSTVLAILSDIHATDSRFTSAVSGRMRHRPPGKGTWLDYGDAASPDPLREFEEFVRSHGRRADYLVVPGDIAHQANGDGLRAAWDRLATIAATLGARAIIATEGNHDVDSRFRSSAYDPTQALRQLSPGFPCADRAPRTEYWANGVASLVFPDVRFIILNSCKFHPNRPAEVEHGRISPEMLDEVQRILDAGPAVRHSVIVCHHHPHPFPMGRETVDDRMVNGEDLIRVLDLDGATWIVIHGHRHVPRVVYGSGGATSPVVFAAGSVAAIIDPQYAPGVRNQAHFLTLVDPAPAGLSVAGEVESLEYTPSAGWEAATAEATSIGRPGRPIPTLPHRSGFGYRGSLDEMGRQIAVAATRIGLPAAWRTVVSQVPAAGFLIPDDFVALKQYLTDTHQLHLVPDGFMPEEVVDG
ncbi:MAG TPA: metallophosphoesterase [Gemmatimonadaceae bacterium]|nr:metallophosphoesterase [Gemmatimonadaceae bacterium]